MKTEVRLSLIYLIVGLIWIFVSDVLLVQVLRLPSDGMTVFNTYKGWAFVLVTTVALYLTLRREFRHRRDTEARLRESQRLTERIVSTVPDAIQIVDIEQLQTTFVNERAKQVFGDTEHPTGRDLRSSDDILHPDDLQFMSALFERASAAADGEIVEVEYRLRNGSGDWRYMLDRSTVFSRHADGAVAQMLSTARDITESKQAEEQLLFQVNVLRNVRDAIISVDADFRVTSWNDAAETIYGYTADEALGKPMPALLKTEHITDSRQTAVDVMIKTGEWRGTLRQWRKDGTPVAILAATTLLKDRNGQMIGFVAVNRDITEQTRLQDETRKNELLRVDLEREINARKLRNRFMSTVSHEFRTPLTTIQLASELLEYYFDRMSEEGRRDRLAQIEIEVKRLLTMLDDIMIVLKTEESGPYFHAEPTDMNALVREIVSEFQLVSKHDRISLTVAAQRPCIDADPKILRPAVVNLLSNAIKYSDPQLPIDVRLVQNGMRLSVSIADQGIGIAPDDLEHLSEAFYRGANVANIPGTGLGLLIVRQAVDIHGGSLEIDSEVGKGTVATIHLPLALETGS